jgi:transposase
VAQSQTAGDRLGEPAEMLPYALADRLQGLEAGGSCMRMDADAFGRAMIDCDKHRGLAFTGNRRRQGGTRQRKSAAVLRLLRGEDLETVSRELGVTAATLTGWHDAFLAAGEAALTSRAATGEELESERLKAKLGAALIERDLLNEKVALLEAGRPFARGRRKP